MMKLILCVTLIWMLSSTDGALQCHDSQTGSNRNCSSNEYCAAAAVQDISGRQQSQLCVPSSICSPSNQTFSFNFGSYNVTAFVHCCNTHSCNSENVTYPDVQTGNSLQCFTCDDGQSSVCNKTVECVGVQDRCVSGSVMMRNNIEKAFGCASRNLCESASELHFLTNHLNFTSGPKCCSSSFCNSAWTFKLSIVPFLLELIMLVAL